MPLDLVQRAQLWAFVMLSLVFLVDQALPLGVAASAPYVVAVLLASASRAPRVVWGSAGLATLLIGLGYALSPSAPSTEEWKVLLNRGLGVGTVWGVAALAVARLQSDARASLARQRSEQSQRLAALGTMSGQIAHDLNNLLVPILSRSELLLDHFPKEDPNHVDVRQIHDAATNAAQLCRQLLLHSGHSPTNRVPLDLSEEVESARLLLAVATASESPVRFELAEPMAPILADPTQLQQILVNLVVNSRESTADGGGEICVRTFAATLRGEDLVSMRHWAEPGPFGCLEVADHGPGIDPDVMEHLFEPFVSTKAAGRGLGLASTLGIVQSHQAALWVESEPGKGATFRVYFPTASEEVPAARVPCARRHGRRAGRVLVVDDEAGIRTTLERLLGRVGYEVESAVDGLDALERFGPRLAEFAAVLVDVAMPRLDGPETVARMRVLRADLPAVLMTGYVDGEKVCERPGVPMLRKPFRRDELLTALDQVTASAP